jgi:multidrug resistance efflux pump
MSLNTDNAQEQAFHPGSIPALLASFRDAAGDDYFHYWLALQHSFIKNAVQGLLVMGAPEADSYAPVASWPVNNSNPERLADICENSLEQRCGLLSLLPTSLESISEKRQYAVSYPIIFDSTLLGVVALEVAADTESELTVCMEQLQWGVSWLELFYLRQNCAGNAQLLSGMKSSFDLLAGVLSEDRFSDAGMLFVTELATLMKCDRVSLGFVRNSHVRVQAISHSASFGSQMNLVRYIGNAMEEAILQRCEMNFPIPPGAKILVTRAHEELSRQQAGESILSLPLHAEERYYGAVTLERPGNSPFKIDEVATCRGIIALVAPILEAKRQNDRMIILKLSDSITTQAKRLLGAGYAGRKLALLFLAIAAIFSVNATGEYRLTAATTLEPSVRRSIVSPFNGYVNEAEVRAGDIVGKGGLLCSLDSRDLSLERSRWLNQQTQYEKQRQEAIASNDRAKANIISSQLEQAAAQLNLVQSQLKRTRLVAPFDGIVVSGDLSQRIDGSVEQGEILFELAPLNSYRIILQVDEYRIADVRKGQRGVLVLPALMERTYEFEVEKITPISSQKEGKNYFRVEAKLVKPDDVLRPGMEGLGKISVDRRNLVSIWTRDVIDWMRMKVWYWWP